MKDGSWSHNFSFRETKWFLCLIVSAETCNLSTMQVAMYPESGGGIWERREEQPRPQINYLSPISSLRLKWASIPPEWLDRGQNLLGDLHVLGIQNMTWLSTSRGERVAFVSKKSASTKNASDGERGVCALGATCARICVCSETTAAQEGGISWC